MKSAKLFVSCLPGDARSDELAALFRKFAKINSVTLAKKRNQISKPYCAGYGFVMCSSPQEADLLLSHSASFRYRGRQIVLKPFKSGKNLVQEKRAVGSRRVFIGDLPSDVTSQDLQQLLGNFGALEAVFIVNRILSNGNKYGYAIFESESTVRFALNFASNLQLRGQPIKIEPFCKKRLEQTVKQSTAPLHKISMAVQDQSSDWRHLEERLLRGVFSNHQEINIQIRVTRSAMSEGSEKANKSIERCRMKQVESRFRNRPDLKVLSMPLDSSSDIHADDYYQV